MKRVALRAGLAAAVLALAWSSWTVLTWPRIARLAHENPATTAFIERHRERGGEVEWQWVPASRISRELQRAVLVAEDINFFDHDGFDRGQIRLALEDWRAGKPLRGASTLTQQLAKNLWLSPSRNPLRKLQEAILTRQLERHLGKPRILELYLNVAQFGPRQFGAEAAARRFFGRSAAALDRRQSAELAASLPRPSTWHPGVDSAGYRRHVASIERRMEKATWLGHHLR